MPRLMEIVTPLGDDVLLFHRMTGREEMSRLFEYQLDLLSTRKDVEIDEILGKNVTVKLARADQDTRYFNGYITRFGLDGSRGRYYRYVATLRPWLWFLTRTSDCKIFQDLTVPDIVKSVFADHPTAAYKLELTGSYRKWKYCVQYRETDFNFISRLLEHEGIYYYVRHTEGHNTLVLTDSTSKHLPVVGDPDVPFISPEQPVKPNVERISRWDFGREIQPGVYVHDDYDLERPKVELRTRKAISRKYTPSDYEVYDYPGGYVATEDGDQYAGVRMDEFASQFELARADCNVRSMEVGSLFNLKGFPREDQNREHLIVAANYDLEFSDYDSIADIATTDYRCTLSAMSTEQQFRPRRLTPKPFVQGPQTAVVVGPPGDEIYTDDFARVKVQFHWDRYGKNDENSSCWIRVAQMWAGKGWGSVSTPRIGHEVIVDFLEGDPDQPIITGSVHNAENAPPHKGVVSGLKSNTHKGRGSNEMTMDDTAGKEKITIHAQYDMGTTVEHDQTNHVKNDFTETIVKNAKISVTEGNLEHDVVAGTAKYHVQGSINEVYDDKQATIVKNDIAIICSAGPIAIASDAQHIFIKGTTSIQLKVGASMIWMDSGGQIGIEGVNIAIKGDASVSTKGTIVISEASGQHTTKGALVLSEAGGTNTIKGSMVMLN
jgi:type VI secretion system secreted protein VgrG